MGTKGHCNGNGDGNCSVPSTREHKRRAKGKKRVSREKDLRSAMNSSLGHRNTHPKRIETAVGGYTSSNSMEHGAWRMRNQDRSVS